LSTQVQEASRTPNRSDENSTSPLHIIVKIAITERLERILKAVREKKQLTYNSKPIKIIADFSTQTLKARRACSEEFQALKENNFSAKILYLEKLLFKIDRGIKPFHDKQNLKQYMTTKPPTQNFLKRILYTEDENKHNHERMGSTQRVALNQLHTLKFLNNNNKTKWQESPHTISTLTLNVNGFNSSIKRHCLVNWIKNGDPIICCIQKTNLIDRNKH
jgi:hypothetical protein